jgi:hypothetical protein
LFTRAYFLIGQSQDKNYGASPSLISGASAATVSDDEVGAAFISGKFLEWQTIDQTVAVVVLLGIAWLLFRAG